MLVFNTYQKYNLDKSLKEFLMLVIWIRIHEHSINDFIVIDPEKYLTDITRDDSTNKNIIDSLSSEFTSFIPLFRNI